jgi:hypothetical protein
MKDSQTNLNALTGNMLNFFHTVINSIVLYCENCKLNSTGFMAASPMYGFSVSDQKVLNKGQMH